jgi:hypothetical protein
LCVAEEGEHRSAAALAVAWRTFAARAARHDASDGMREFAAVVARTHPGNPLFGALHLAEAHDVAAYAGTHELTIREGYGVAPAVGGTLLLTVLGDGRAHGSVLLPDGDAYALRGTVDAEGDLVAELTGGEAPGVVYAKLAPVGWFDPGGPLEGRVQPFLVLDANGGRGGWAATP